MNPLNGGVEYRQIQLYKLIEKRKFFSKICITTLEFNVKITTKSIIIQYISRTSLL